MHPAIPASRSCFGSSLPPRTFTCISLISPPRISANFFLMHKTVASLRNDSLHFLGGELDISTSTDIIRCLFCGTNVNEKIVQQQHKSICLNRILSNNLKRRQRIHFYVLLAKRIFSVEKEVPNRKLFVQEPNRLR